MCVTILLDAKNILQGSPLSTSHFPVAQVSHELLLRRGEVFWVELIIEFQHLVRDDCAIPSHGAVLSAGEAIGAS
jgi:hypothetical protein